MTLSDQPKKRKIIQITTSGSGYTVLVALCDDGTVWFKLGMDNGGWAKLRDIPQPGE